MDLKRAEKEPPRRASERPGKEIFAREEGDGHAGGEDGDDGCKEGDALEGVGGVGVEFVEGVEGAPEVGDFVFEEAAGEGEDAVDGLGELDEGGVVAGCGVGVEKRREGGEERGGRRGLFVGGGVGVVVLGEEGAGY